MKNTTTILREDLLNTPCHQRGTANDSQPSTLNLQPALPGLDKIVKPFRFAPSPYVYKVVPLREARTPDQMTLCDTPEAAAAYWRLHVPHAEAFDPECECFTVLLLNTRRRIKAHHLVSVGNPSFTPPTTTPPAATAPAIAHEYPRRPQIRHPAQRPTHP